MNFAVIVGIFVASPPPLSPHLLALSSKSSKSYSTFFCFALHVHATTSPNLFLRTHNRTPLDTSPCSSSAAWAPTTS